MKFFPLNPTWTGHMFHALEWQGWTEPRINVRRHLTAHPPSEPRAPRVNVSRSDEGVEALAQAFVLADLACASEVGGYLLNRLIPGPLPDGLKFKQEAIFGNHREYLAYLVMSSEFAAQHVATQLGSQN